MSRNMSRNILALLAVVLGTELYLCTIPKAGSLWNIREDYCKIYCRGSCFGFFNDRMCFKSNNRIETNHFQLDLQAGHLRIKWKESRGSRVSNVTAITDESATKLESLTVTGIPSSEDVRFRPGIDYIRDLGVATVLKYEIYSKDLIVLETESSLMEGPSDLTLIYTLSSESSIDSHAANTYIRGTMNNLKTIQICHGQESQTPEFWMEDGIFRGKAQLRLLAFQGFKMENLTAHTLEDLKGLKILNFSKTTVKDQSFLSSENLRNTLENFVMGGTEIAIETRYFENYSQLKFIAGSKFEPHENVTAFMCKENFLYCMFTRGVHGTRCPVECKCRYEPNEGEFIIDCSERNLNEIPPLPSPITGFTTLKFRGNNLRQLPSHSTSGYDHVNRLDVSENNLHSLRIEQLPEHLERLNIAYNNISTLDKYLVNYLYKNLSISLNNYGNLFMPYCDERLFSDFDIFFSKFRERSDSHIRNFLTEHARSIQLTDDPWYCFWKMAGVLSSSSRRVQVGYERIYAVALEFSQYQGDCPDCCTCLRNSYTMEFIVDCRDEGLSAIPPLPMPTYGQTALLFQNNKLRALPNDTWPGYGSVGRLFLANNRLTALDHLPHNLTYLDIRNNRISAIRRKTLEFLERRKESSDLRLFLSGNPWACTCEEKDFLGFVKGGGSRIGDVTNITCGDTPGNLLIDTEESDICPSGLVHYVTLTVSFMLMVLTINLIIYFKQPLLIWCYEHDVCLSLAARRELDERKKFDAFLSFTHKDEELIGEFVERLENGGQKFRLCFYLRDWLVGESIPECISQSVKDSRRIIILMTNNFLKSTWGRLEFRLALHATSQDRCKRLIVVLYPEVENFDDLDSELRAYMVLSTYLKRDDPNFWSKLIYSMPHGTRKAQRWVKWSAHADEVIEFT
ncbi:LOW QUALITY PROTEIN: protein toll-like [Drosophila obscura]|uniref:LOW QUALITY PROTEIN: protein toll-like n=1 Tax=Drosophila obscura TaxID=7282 RepID=UPI001BB16713|nr:LOW QUALITY PROTEIN: protein toll-like [Drosophila obscura]